MTRAKTDVTEKAEQQAQAADAILEVLVDAIIDRQLVPLLGAGVSIPARTQRKNLPPGFQNVSSLVDELHKQLSAEDPSGLPAIASSRNHLRRLRRYRRLADLCELFVDVKSSRHGGTGHSISWAHWELCNILRIFDFVWLCPTKAHRLIAFLSCEGLIAEVITTNYDSCLERAFADAQGLNSELLIELEQRGRRKEINTFGWNEGVDVRVSYDLATYRQSACRLSAGMNAAKTPYLRVHKINGCARAFRHERFRPVRIPAGQIRGLRRVGREHAGPMVRTHRHALRVRHVRTLLHDWRSQNQSERHLSATRILLTERQLQSWRDRQWAADLVRDRLRTRKILTCGFGSEEPQVRHTVALITEEEVADGTNEGQAGILHRPNLILVAGFDSGPTFAQHQVLTAQCNASASNGFARGRGSATGRYDAYDAFLGPEARAGFKYANNADSKLPADDLWLELYGRVASRLLHSEVGPGGSFVRILRSVVSCGGVLVERLSRRLFVAPGAQEIRKRLFDWATETATLASEIIEAVDPLERAGKPRGGRYRSLREDSFTLLWFMTIRIALGVPPVPSDGIEAGDLAALRARLREPRTTTPASGEPKPVELQVRLSMHGPQTPPRDGDDVVLAIGSPASKPPPAYSAYSAPVVRERDDRGRGWIRRAAPVVDLQNALRAEGRSLSDAARFDDLMRRIVLFPTEPQRWGQRGVRSLNRRS